MNIDRYIIDLLGMDSYTKGRRYYSWYVRKLDEGKLDDGYYYKFSVESERVYRHYKVEINIINYDIEKYSCNCERFKSHHTCKHIAACIYKHGEEMAKKLMNPLQLSSIFLNNYKSSAAKVKNNIKEAMTLKIELIFDNEVKYKLHVGVKKNYMLNSDAKLRNFLDAYYNGGDYKLGKEFTYNRDKYYFNSSDSELFDFLTESVKSNYSDLMSLSRREVSALINKLRGRCFIIKGLGEIKDVLNGMPTDFILDIKDGIYHMKVDDLYNYHVLYNYPNYVVYRNVLYIIPEKYLRFIFNLLDLGMDELVFEKKI